MRQCFFLTLHKLENMQSMREAYGELKSGFVLRFVQIWVSSQKDPPLRALIVTRSLTNRHINKRLFVSTEGFVKVQPRNKLVIKEDKITKSRVS